MYKIDIKIHSQKNNSFGADIFIFKNRKPVIKIGSVNQFSQSFYQILWDIPKLQYWIKRGIQIDRRVVSFNFSKNISITK